MVEWEMKCPYECLLQDWRFLVLRPTKGSSRMLLTGILFFFFFVSLIAFISICYHVKTQFTTELGTWRRCITFQTLWIFKEELYLLIWLKFDVKLFLGSDCYLRMIDEVVTLLNFVLLPKYKTEYGSLSLFLPLHGMHVQLLELGGTTAIGLQSSMFW